MPKSRHFKSNFSDLVSHWRDSWTLYRVYRDNERLHVTLSCLVFLSFWICKSRVLRKFLFVTWSGRIGAIDQWWKISRSDTPGEQTTLRNGTLDVTRRTLVLWCWGLPRSDEADEEVVEERAAEVTSSWRISPEKSFALVRLVEEKSGKVTSRESVSAVSRRFIYPSLL